MKSTLKKIYKLMCGGHIFALVCEISVLSILVILLAGVHLDSRLLNFLCVSFGVIALSALIASLIKMSSRNGEQKKKKKNKRSELIRIKGAKENCRDKPIKVVFYCDDGAYWDTFEALYKSMRDDPSFDVVILAAPEMKVKELVKYSACDFLDAKGYPYIKGYDAERNTWIKLEELSSDYYFYNRHYAYRQPRQLSFCVAANFGKLCYIPYAACPARGTTQDILCRFDDLRYFDFLFCENETYAKVYGSYKEKYGNVKTKITPVGSPKFDMVRKLPVYKRSEYSQVILYTPRWNYKEGTCSFFDLFPLLFQWIEARPDVYLIFRPHPLMANEIGKQWGAEKWDSFIAEFDCHKNAEVDTHPEYLASFSRATVLVSDISSMMLEFFITGKPVVYMEYKDVLSDFSKAIFTGFYTCSSAMQLESCLGSLLEGCDPLQKVRQSLMEREYSLSDGYSTDRILDTVKNDFYHITDAIDENNGKSA